MSTMFANAAAFNNAGHPLRTDDKKWNMSKVKNMSFMFRGASAFNQDISNWDTSKVVNMQNTFASAIAFNQNISSWNISKVKTMSQMFSGASAFNQNVSNWDTSSVENMQNTFSSAIAFNQDISSWNISNVKTMSQMFYGATAFNNAGKPLLTDGTPGRPSDKWITSNVDNMRAMFYNAIGFTNYAAGVGLWDFTNIKDVSGVSDASSNFYGFAYKIGTSADQIDCSANFSKFLHDLSGNETVNNNLNMGVVGIKNSISTPNESFDYLTNVKHMKISFHDVAQATRDINLNDERHVFNSDEHEIHSSMDQVIENQSHIQLCLA
jgi:surface protein